MPAARHTLPSIDDPLPVRKGARRRSEVPPDVLAALNAGTDEARTLVEMLSFDLVALASAVARDCGFSRNERERFLAFANELAPSGILQRMRGMGAALQGTFGACDRAPAVFSRLARHRSDSVRSWVAYWIGATPGVELARRLTAIRPFAADRNMGVREWSWMSLRPHLAAELPQAIALLRPWTLDPDPAIRRFAIESIRPRGVWCEQIEALKADPVPALPLLEAVRSDPSDYVRRSVANWLNDASKSQPDWVVAISKRWQRESPTRETKWICSHALRTLRKKGLVADSRAK